MSDQQLTAKFSKRLAYGMTEQKVRSGLKGMWVQSPDGPWVGSVVTERGNGESDIEVFAWAPGENEGFPIRGVQWGTFENRDIVTRDALTIRLKEPGVQVYVFMRPSTECVSLVFDEQGGLSDLIRFDAGFFDFDTFETPPRRISLTPEPAP